MWVVSVLIYADSNGTSITLQRKRHCNLLQYILLNRPHSRNKASHRWLGALFCCRLMVTLAFKHLGGRLPVFRQRWTRHWYRRFPRDPPARFRLLKPLDPLIGVVQDLRRSQWPRLKHRLIASQRRPDSHVKRGTSMIVHIRVPPQPISCLPLTLPKPRQAERQQRAQRRPSRRAFTVPAGLVNSPNNASLQGGGHAASPNDT
mmetsp:Transcript_18607/g.41259  ORF Transcript_18607/g.41259 Transcript_18607/m.41259 type:complete len:203 (-) Transcript_18607:403-1011(-)